MQQNKYMQLAYNKAKQCLLEHREVPVACLIINKNNEILALEHNLTYGLQNPTYHAEILAINKACEKIGSSKLNDCTIYTTLEPCLMCVGALMHARINNIYFGAYDKKYGALESNNVFLYNPQLAYKPNVFGGIMAKECGDLIDEFFKKLRN